MSEENNATWATDEARRKFRTINSVLMRFRDLDGELPLQQMLVLCWVALNEGKTQTALCQALEMPTSSSSRNIAALSTVHRLGKPGLGLVTWVDNPQDRRAKILMLTTKGRSFVQRLIETQ